jgi:hypothetical protein
LLCDWQILLLLFPRLACSFWMPLLTPGRLPTLSIISLSGLTSPSDFGCKFVISNWTDTVLYVVRIGTEGRERRIHDSADPRRHRRVYGVHGNVFVELLYQFPLGRATYRRIRQLTVINRTLVCIYTLIVTHWLSNNDRKIFRGYTSFVSRYSPVPSYIAGGMADFYLTKIYNDSTTYGLHILLCLFHQSTPRHPRCMVYS